MAEEARGAIALYILGDLFEYWLGDDVPSETGERVATALSRLAESGVACHFMAGNRDFLLGEEYASRCGMDLLPDELVIDLNGAPTLLLHGDTLCTDDRVYQQVRATIRAPQWREQFLAQSPEERLAFVRDAREKSREHQQSVSMEITDVNQDAVRSAFDRHGVTEMIHGHTHRLAIHRHETDGGIARRIVLGDWYTRGSVLRVAAESRELVELR